MAMVWLAFQSMVIQRGRELWYEQGDERDERACSLEMAAQEPHRSADAPSSADSSILNAAS
jgi:hypothetical protein